VLSDPPHVKRAVGLLAIALLLWAPSQAWAVATWAIQPTPNPGTLDSFAAVSSSSSTNAWAVGSYVDGSGVRQTLVERSDGTTWTIQPSQNLGAGDNQRYGVKATSATNAWAVGTRYYAATGRDVNLIEHWDGTSWTHQTVADYSNAFNRLLAVAANSSTNAIAVGDTLGPNDICGLLGSVDARPVITRWDGTSWSIMKSPNPSPDADSLHGVAMASTSNAWAVGCTGSSTSYFGPLIEHWNGSTWSVQHLSTGPTSMTQLESVSATSPTNVWAVGWTDEETSPTIDESFPVIEHYDGARWKEIGQPIPLGRLYAVKATSATNAWAAGYWITGTSDLVPKPLVLHWDGTSWSVQAQLTTADGSILTGLSSTSASYAFAAGFQDAAADGSTSDTLAMRCC
jgi:hypothetical protein